MQPIKALQTRNEDEEKLGREREESAQLEGAFIIPSEHLVPDRINEGRFSDQIVKDTVCTIEESHLVDGSYMLILRSQDKMQMDIVLPLTWPGSHRLPNCPSSSACTSQETSETTTDEHFVEWSAYQSQIFPALYGDTLYPDSLHQCSHKVVWYGAERLRTTVSRLLEDGRETWLRPYIPQSLESLGGESTDGGTWNVPETILYLGGEKDIVPLGVRKLDLLGLWGSSLCKGAARSLVPISYPGVGGPRTQNWVP
ncbi:uncharacterized protein F5Z01DRAFT_197006 [Emericellopsis atlantica]|uniref:Uncharacterized protein n=1 Tax=Emericellopsis atlantica TaxID=2614577 RepID=A0A9P7ZUA8_9HYPO|nr:uncharacterized protein F5Z01DRAFT_197006 [Emericellopsis atlantica]KAG9258459.1 hypothetical protein F5Z01DRAFT_197006 [Emericellopsis atlantica]